ncbi:hypothetical protein SESBI_42264 [Sesbania bispinosa]|nr:hypothetical protein SESBI_42264 [Sesbania bispinosa]
MALLRTVTMVGCRMMGRSLGGWMDRCCEGKRINVAQMGNNDRDEDGDCVGTHGGARLRRQRGENRGGPCQRDSDERLVADNNESVALIGAEAVEERNLGVKGKKRQ